jgi:hypothetical protein
MLLILLCDPYNAGKGSIKHEGNARYLQLIRDSMDTYKDVTKKSERSAIVANVVTSLREGGVCFVRFDDTSSRWYDIGDDQAKKKTGHAIRDLLLSRGDPIRGGKKKTGGTSMTTSQPVSSREKIPYIKDNSVDDVNNPQAKRQKVGHVMAESVPSTTTINLRAPFLSTSTSGGVPTASVGSTMYNNIGSFVNPNQQIVGMNVMGNVINHNNNTGPVGLPVCSMGQSIYNNNNIGTQSGVMILNQSAASNPQLFVYNQAPRMNPVNSPMLMQPVDVHSFDTNNSTCVLDNNNIRIMSTMSGSRQADTAFNPNNNTNPNNLPLIQMNNISYHSLVPQMQQQSNILNVTNPMLLADVQSFPIPQTAPPHQMMPSRMSLFQSQPLINMMGEMYANERQMLQQDNRPLNLQSQQQQRQPHRSTVESTANIEERDGEEVKLSLSHDTEDIVVAGGVQDQGGDDEEGLPGDDFSSFDWTF